MSTKDHQILLPPRYNHYQKDNWHLLYDPTNVTWIRVNTDGLKILNTLKHEKTISKTCKALALDSPLDNEKNLRQCVEPYIQNLIEVGFLHLNNYCEKKREFNCMNVPADIYLMMTYQCNLKCRYCYNIEDRAHFNKIPPMMHPSELSIAAYHQLIKEAFSLGVKRFLFTGGEPLLNPNTIPLAQYAKALGLKTELISNGLLIKQNKARELADAFDFITLSLDAIEPNTHELLRGPNTFTRVLNSIRWLKEYEGKIHINTVITKYNVTSLLEIWKEVVEVMHCDQFTPSLYTPNSINGTSILELLPTLEELQKEQKRAMFYFKKYPAVLMSGTKFRFSCGIANGEICISFDGTVYPCHLLLKPELNCGNVKDKGLADILNGSLLLQQLRNFNINNIDICNTCDFKYLCGGGCHALSYNSYGHFNQPNNLYCQYRISDYIEQMWSESLYEVKQKKPEVNV